MELPRAPCVSLPRVPIRADCLPHKIVKPTHPYKIQANMESCNRTNNNNKNKRQSYFYYPSFKICVRDCLVAALGVCLLVNALLSGSHSSSPSSRAPPPPSASIAPKTTTTRDDDDVVGPWSTLPINPARDILFQFEESHNKKNNKRRRNHDRVVCPCCGWTGPAFSKFRGRMNARCRRCNAKERHRKFCATLACGDKLNFTITDQRDESSNNHPSSEQQHKDHQQFQLLHFGPEHAMFTLLEQLEPKINQTGLDYFTGNHFYKDAQFGDVTNLTHVPDNAIDGIVILHVLEHVRALDRALAELKRVLRGWMYVEVPCRSFPNGKSVDCRRYTQPKDLLACAEQADHVWNYDCDDFSHKLQDAGLACHRSNTLDAQATCLAETTRAAVAAKDDIPTFLCHVN